VLALVEEPEIAQAVPEPAIGRCDGGVVLGSMNLALDLQAALEAITSPGEIALAAQHARQLMKAGDDSGMSLGAMAPSHDLERLLEVNASPGELSLDAEGAGQLVEGGCDGGVVLCAVHLVVDLE